MDNCYIDFIGFDVDGTYLYHVIRFDDVYEKLG